MKAALGKGFEGRAILLQVGQEGRVGCSAKDRLESWAVLKVGAEQRWGLRSPWPVDVL